MTPDAPGMTTPVTRGELREDHAQQDQKFKQWLEIWGGTLLARIELTEQRVRDELSPSERGARAPPWPQRHGSRARTAHAAVSDSARRYGNAIKWWPSRLSPSSVPVPASDALPPTSSAPLEAQVKVSLARDVNFLPSSSKCHSRHLGRFSCRGPRRSVAERA